jgi:hypothetical protein
MPCVPKQARTKTVEWGLGGRGAGMAEGDQCLPVAEALMNGNVPLCGDRRQDA